MDRVPHGQVLTKDFPVLQYKNIPVINLRKWSFKILGLVTKQLEFTYKQFNSLPSTEVVSDFHCVTGWSKLDIRWEGVLFKTLASIVKPLAEAKFVNILSEDNYTTNIPLEVAMDEDVIFAYEYDEKPLPLEHGFPLRLIVPKKYAYKSAKWVLGVEFLKEDKPGYWEIRGYSNSADPWKEERFSK